MNFSYKRIFKFKRYPHFDQKKHYRSYLHSIQNPEWIVKHGFYPFIHFKIKSLKFDGKNKKTKERDIYYSSHIDRYIYEYYGFKLNNYYNNIVKCNGINKSVIAYRNGLHKNNIHFAKEVLEFILKIEKSFIFVGDFTNYFDNLDHKYLKSQIQNLLQVNTLPEDYYKIYKSVTKFTYIEYEDILCELNCKRNDLEELNKIFDTKKFHEVKKKYLKKNENNYGIPQGSSISAVLSNIYLLEFDKKVNDFVTSKRGIYRRYCDDIIVVIPLDSDCDAEIKSFYDTFMAFVNLIPRLLLQASKTDAFIFSNQAIYNISNTFMTEHKEAKNILNYLGFSFDGKSIRVREKSIFKFYSKLYHKIKIVNKYSQKYNRNVFRKRLFKMYSHLGARQRKDWRGNFLTYTNRVQKIFSNSLYSKNKIKNHWRKIGKLLIKIQN